MKTILFTFQLFVIFKLTAVSPNVSKHLDYNSIRQITDCILPTEVGIHDLKDGVIIDAYDFFDGDEKALSLLGFFNVDIKKQERITVIEYLQKGSLDCDGKVKKYGIGARLMMRVTSHKKKARLDTPQQITASVIFGKATVKFSMHTFGITGPGVANLNRVGSITENTYSSFISGISDLLAEAYEGSNQYIIRPQLLE
ncbi:MULTISPECIES: hypothetical protein [Croceitalea]|uniref:Secreted protein n=1 Tax=Croceitalea vernalis TaxID=3075599 RepID=A0ABU3BE68_9FLAO|nr:MULTISPECIES: hypothetical protein [unclassified Croceitalea]MDT0538647.1 hypothetical protein [Croceitalea sp. P059]MDT0620431.1 hypothetical protein [Croceitalea sp. P007]